MATKTTSKKKASGPLSAAQAFRQLMTDKAHYSKLSPIRKNYFRQLRSRLKAGTLRPDTIKKILVKNGYTLTNGKFKSKK